VHEGETKTASNALNQARINPRSNPNSNRTVHPVSHPLPFVALPIPHLQPPPAAARILVPLAGVDGTVGVGAGAGATVLLVVWVRGGVGRGREVDTRMRDCGGACKQHETDSYSSSITPTNSQALQRNQLVNAETHPCALSCCQSPSYTLPSTATNRPLPCRWSNRQPPV